MRALFLVCFMLSVGLFCGCATSTDQNQSTANANTGINANSTINANATARTSPVATAPTAGGDNNFINAVAMDGMAEVELAHLAMQKTKNAEVKQFAERMVADHSKANAELKQLASNKNVTLPAAPNAEQKADKNRLSQLSGAEFDREYMSLMASAHDKAVAAFETESREGSETDVRSWATKILPTLRQHQTIAKQIVAKLPS